MRLFSNFTKTPFFFNSSFLQQQHLTLNIDHYNDRLTEPTDRSPKETTSVLGNCCCTNKASFTRVTSVIVCGYCKRCCHCPVSISVMCGCYKSRASISLLDFCFLMCYVNERLKSSNNKRTEV